MSQRVLCKFFANGACLKGEHCEYSHDWKAPPNNICTFYQKGLCVYGSRCRYEHVRSLRSQSTGSSSSPPPTTTISHARISEPALSVSKSECESEVEESVVMCSYAAAGECPRGEKCRQVHGDVCPRCGKRCLHPTRREEREEHARTCEKRQQQLEALKRSQEIECSVCLERVLSKPSSAERKFGLMSECDHPFCISCIRNWRGSSPASGLDLNTALRACPICRKLSYFVVPSVIWYSTKLEKQQIVDAYKSKLKSIDCKHFDFGNGNCPFGTSCFYKHTVRPGSYFWTYHSQPPSRSSRQVHDLDDLFYFDRDTPDSPNGRNIYLSDFEAALLLSQLEMDDTSNSCSSDDDD